MPPTRPALVRGAVDTLRSGRKRFKVVELFDCDRSLAEAKAERFPSAHSLAMGDDVLREHADRAMGDQIPLTKGQESKADGCLA